MRIAQHVPTTESAPRAVRRGLVVAAAGAAILLVTVSVAYACTFGVHGGLLIVQEEPSQASASGGPTVDPNGNGQIDLKLYSTDNNKVATPFVPNNPYDVYIDPSPLGAGAAANTGGPSQCDSKDVDIGDIAYGFEENGIPAQDTTATDDDDDPDRYLYGEGSASIDPTDTDTTNNARDGGDVAAPDPPAVGTYEICAMPHPDDHWDHFRIVYTS